MKIYFATFFFFFFPIIMVIGQEANEIICPVTPNCYILEPSSKIPSLKSDGEYFGKIYVETQIDTITLKLINHKIVFAKLRSTIDLSDTLEIRLNKLTGNKSIIDGLRTDIINHISYLTIKKVCEGDGLIPKYILPVEIIK